MGLGYKMLQMPKVFKQRVDKFKKKKIAIKYNASSDSISR